MKGSIAPTSGGRGEGPVQILYESPTTRVFRDPQASPGVVFKEPLGTHSAQRQQTETLLLSRLASIASVAQLAPGMQSPGLIALKDFAGIPLDRRLQAGAIPIDLLLPLALQLARSVADIHRAGVIHRDINPANILLSASGALMLIDFDLAILANDPAVSRQEGTAPQDVPAQDRVVGTLGYLAPEQTGRTGRAVDQRADLYAIGATLYEMATGRRPFEGTDTLQLIHDHLVREPAAPSTVDPRVPASFSAIVMRLLAKSPERRYQSAEGLLHDLDRLQTELAAGGTGTFELGQRDFAARLDAPLHLVGRDAELELLRAAFAESLRTTRRLVLIEGATGVGKSALVNEFRPWVAAAGGLFVRGKFDQFQKDGTVGGGMIQAARVLGRLLLALPLDELAAQRERILEKLGRSAGLLRRLVPEFAVLLGPQPDAPEVDPRHAELQVQHAMLQLLSAVASAQRPLVVVLDDLQWAGAHTLRAFDRFVNEPELRGVLLIGVYRPGDGSVVEPGPALYPFLEQWRRLPNPPLEIALGNLGARGLRELAAQMLRLSTESAGELADAIATLTRGNPFDTVEMINALRREGVLQLGAAGWHWEDSAIRHFVGATNLGDLLNTRIALMPDASRRLLEAMSCLANPVDSKLLGVAVGLPDTELRDLLRAPLEDGLVVMEHGSRQDAVAFRHDRVQQAVFGAMDARGRQQLQLAMARRLAQEGHYDFDAAQRYLACIEALDDPAEQRAVAKLLDALALRLVGTAAYALAERPLEAAASLLADLADPADDAWRTALDIRRHETFYSLARLDESDRLYASLRARITDVLGLVEPTVLQTRSLEMRGRMDDAMNLAVDVLARLGLQAPPGYAIEDAAERLAALSAWVQQDSATDAMTRPQLQDPTLLGIAKLLSRIARVAIVRYDEPALIWSLLESQRLWAEHGPCPELVACLGRMCAVMISARQDYRGGYEFARHVLQVGESLGYERQIPEARFTLATYGSHWMERVETTFGHSTGAFEGLLGGGDASIAGYGHLVLFTNLIEIASTADVTLAEIDEGLGLCRRTGNLHAAALHTALRQTLRAQRGLTDAAGSFDDAQFNTEVFLARTGHLPFIANAVAECRAMHWLIMGDGTALATDADKGLATIGNLPGYYMTVYAHLFVAIARAWELQAADASIDRDAALDQLDVCLAWLTRRAKDQPYNFLHLQRWVEAERAWAVGDLWRAAGAFDAAVAEAQARHRPWHRAVITERAGRFHLSQGLVHMGFQLLVDARDQYQVWGATVKVAQMHRDHPPLLSPTRGHESAIAVSQSVRESSASVSPEALDLIGVLRASQALSSQTSLEALTGRVSEVVSALSGATKVLVLAWSADQWWLLTPVHGESAIPVARAAERRLVPISAVRYAERIAEAVVVDDALMDDRFARDPYFSGVPLCSMLVAPIATQGATRAMLILESRTGRGAFSTQRLDAVMLIAGQLAVSLSNAQLYESLELRVQARTRELEQTQAALVATARRAGMAEIANNVLHNVGNVLNSVNVSASVVRRTISNSRLEGLNRAVTLMNQHGGDLGGFMERDPRGKALLAYLNELVAVLGTERDNALDDLERLTRSVDHIIYVVATQQSHAGPSNVLEIVQPADLMADAVQLTEEAIQRYGVAVIQRYDDMPVAALDRQRLLQILVNLIGNAAQAMEGLPAKLRQLTLGAAIVRGDRLHLSVRDEGEGIAPENLERLFAHGFTTRTHGHGFGLHSSALAALEMGGKLTAHSDGVGKGATFTIELPLKPLPPGSSP